MITLSLVLLGISSLGYALPLYPRSVTALDTAAFQEAQQRDNTATRAFSNTEIKTSDGQCLFIDLLSGDFRANLNPIGVSACDGSQGQQWDIITAGKHNDQPGQMLVVNTLTQACMNFDPRRAAGNTVIMFSCGGRADGGGAVTNSQLFAFNGGAPQQLSPENAANTTCLVVSGNVLDQAACDGSAAQQFTFGTGGAVAPAPSATDAGVTTNADADAATTTSVAEAASTDAAATITSAATASEATANPTTPVPVSRAGGTLDPSAAAEANPRDNTATRAFSAAPIKAADGRCLSIDPTAGDFRENLIPIQLAACDGSAGQQFDVITSGVHNNQANSALIVSSLTQGCLNFDPRRAAGDTVIMFSCGGRADGGGAVTDSQLFSFTGSSSLALTPNNAKGTTCLAPNGDRLDSTNCDNAADQLFTIG